MCDLWQRLCLPATLRGVPDPARRTGRAKPPAVVDTLWFNPRAITRVYWVRGGALAACCIHLAVFCQSLHVPAREQQHRPPPSCHATDELLFWTVNMRNERDTCMCVARSISAGPTQVTSRTPHAAGMLPKTEPMTAQSLRTDARPRVPDVLSGRQLDQSYKDLHKRGHSHAQATFWGFHGPACMYWQRAM